MRNTFLIPVLFFVSGILCSGYGLGQLHWQQVDSLYQPLPGAVHVYKTTSLLDGKPNIAYYVEADLKDRSLDFTMDTADHMRLTPAKFYEKNAQPLLVVNTTFFSFTTHQSLNVVIKDGKLLSYNVHTIPGRGKDTFTYRHPLGSAIGISKRGDADIAWLYTDSGAKKPVAFQRPVPAIKDSLPFLKGEKIAGLTEKDMPAIRGPLGKFFRWKKMRTAVGGGPVLLQDGNIKVTNNEEIKFAGKAIDDKHPRTAIGYTPGHKLIILVVQGRMPGIAEGATLTQTAQLLKEIGCREALNLDGGGSSCMLVNGKETIRPSDKEGQRAVPAVLVIRRK